MRWPSCTALLRLVLRRIRSSVRTAKESGQRLAGSAKARNHRQILLGTLLLARKDDNLAVGRLIAELKGQIRVLEERMETKQAEYRTDISILAEKLSENIGRIEKDAAKRDKETAQRDKDNLRWTIGFGIAQIAITIAVIGAGVAILGLLIGLPTN